MGVLNKIKQYIQRKNPEVVAEEIAKTYAEKKENGEEHPIDTTVDKVIQIMQKNLSESDARKALTELFENEKVPDRVALKTAIKISENEELPDNIITDAIKESESVTPEAIDTLIEEGSIDTEQRMKLIKQIEDEKIKEQRILSELEKLYTDNKEKTDNEVIDMLDTLKQLLGDNKSENVNKLMEKVIAKKMAENYYSDKMKTTRIYGFSKVIPLEQMVKGNLPAKVKIEFEKLEAKDGPKSGRFNELQLGMQMYNELSKFDSKNKEKESETKENKGTDVNKEGAEVTR